MTKLFDGCAGNLLAGDGALGGGEVVALPLSDAVRRCLQIDRQLFPNFLLRVQLLIGTSGFISFDENLNGKKQQN